MTLIRLCPDLLIDPASIVSISARRADKVGTQVFRPCVTIRWRIGTAEHVHQDYHPADADALAAMERMEAMVREATAKEGAKT